MTAIQIRKTLAGIGIATNSMTRTQVMTTNDPAPDGWDNLIRCGKNRISVTSRNPNGGIDREHAHKIASEIARVFAGKPIMIDVVTQI